MAYKNNFFRELEDKIDKNNGLHNAHAHIDRFNTNCKSFLEIENTGSASLKQKQSMTGNLHQGKAYTKESLEERIKQFLVESAKIKTKRVDSFIDVATDIPLDDGLGAINIALKLKEELKDKIDFRVGAYPIFGFTNKNPKRWELFLESVKLADFIGTLPERDCYEFYGADNSHIGFRNHLTNAIRFYNSSIMGKLACGKLLDADDLKII